MLSGIIKSRINAPKTGYHTISSFILDRLKAWIDDTVLLDCDLDRRWTGEQVYEACLNIAYQLVKEYGLKQGDIVCSMVPNSDLHAIAIIGVIVAGGVYCPLSQHLSYRDADQVMTDMNANYLITDSVNYGIVATIASELSSFKKLLLIDEDSRKELKLDNCVSIEELIQKERSFMTLPDSGSLNDTVMLMMSDRAIDKPKPVIRTNRNLIALANALQNQELAQCSRDDIIMSPCFSRICGVRALLQSITGGSVLALSRSDIRRELFLDSIEKYRITSAFLTPTEIFYLASNDSITGEFDLSSLRDVIISAATLPDGVLERMRHKFKLKYFRTAYQTADIGWALQLFNSDSTTVAQSNGKTVGRPVSGVEIKVIDFDGEPLASNAIGEVCVSSDQVTTGYLNDYEENAKTFTTDGFLKTGEMGYFDSNGLFYIVSGSKNAIRVEGELVLPADIECVIRAHNEVENVSVIGVEDEICGEAPKAFVILKQSNQSSVDHQSLLEFVNLRVYRGKRLKGGLEFVDKLPNTASSVGKIVESDIRRVTRITSL